MSTRGTIARDDPAIPAEDTLATAPQITNKELAVQIAALQAAFEEFKRDTARRRAERSDDPLPVMLVPLKSACSAENYERARRMCARGLVPSRKFGGY
jgi:hypothetical protein